jgi:hypothetical protein
MTHVDQESLSQHHKIFLEQGQKDGWIVSHYPSRTHTLFWYEDNGIVGQELDVHLLSRGDMSPFWHKEVQQKYLKQKVYDFDEITYLKPAKNTA